jgi:hypothetical protein
VKCYRTAKKSGRRGLDAGSAWRDGSWSGRLALYDHGRMLRGEATPSYGVAVHVGQIDGSHSPKGAALSGAALTLSQRGRWLTAVLVLRGFSGDVQEHIDSLVVR